MVFVVGVVGSDVIVICLRWWYENDRRRHFYSKHFRFR